MARVVLTSEAREDVRDLDGHARKLVLKALKKLEDSPNQRGEPLGSQDNTLTTFRKLVVGDRDHRVIFRVEPSGDVVVVWVVGKRADRQCYDLAVARLQTYAANPALARELQALVTDVWVHTEGQ
jgi:mRNA interferase RelE/StbE